MFWSKAKTVAAIRKRIFEMLCTFDDTLVPLRHRLLAPVLRHELSRWLLDTPKTWVLRKGRRIGASSVICTRLFAAWVLVCGPLLKLPPSKSVMSLPPGEQLVLGLVSVKRGEAENRIGNITAVFDALGIAYSAAGDEIQLKDFPIAVRVLTRNWKTAVGETIGVLWMDEVSRWDFDDDSQIGAKDVFSTLLPSTDTIPASLVVMASSVWSEVDFHAECYDQGDTSFQVTSCVPTWLVNAELTEQACLENARGDVAIFNREYAAIPGGTIFGALDVVDVDAAFETSPLAGTSAFLSIDASSLRKDGFAWVAGHYSDLGINVAEVTELNGKDLRKMKLKEVIHRVAERARAWGAGTVFGDQRETAGCESYFTDEQLNFHSYAWSDTSKEQAFVLLRQLLRDRRISLCENAELRKEMVGCKCYLMPSGRTKYATNGLDRLSALISLCHAINDGQIILQTEVDYRRYRDPNNPLSSFNQEERFVSTVNGVAIIRGGTGRYPSALDY
jgi:hypothetical protein